jgi:hypothetical protein
LAGGDEGSWYDREDSPGGDNFPGYDLSDWPRERVGTREVVSGLPSLCGVGGEGSAAIPVCLPVLIDEGSDLPESADGAVRKAVQGPITCQGCGALGEVVPERQQGHGQGVAGLPASLTVDSCGGMEVPERLNLVTDSRGRSEFADIPRMLCADVQQGTD